MDPIVILITLIATFGGDKAGIQFYSHNPNVVFVSEDMCNDVLREATTYFYDGAELYARQEFPNDTLSTLTLECMQYTIDNETGEFEPLEYEYNGEWNDYSDFEVKPKGMQI